jgi:enamine deaminase RidA (YjgF/YER057c/UK114 family)
MDIRRIGLRDNNSRSVAFDDLVFLSGITADDKSADMAGQTRQVLKKIDRHLADAGTNKSRLLAATVYLAEISLKDDMNVSAVPTPPSMRRDDERVSGF